MRSHLGIIQNCMKERPSGSRGGGGGGLPVRSRPGCADVSLNKTLNPPIAKAGAACSVAVKLRDLDPQGRWFDPRCGQDKIRAAVGPLSKALNPTLLQGVCLLLSLINCKSLWIKASAKWHVMVGALLLMCVGVWKASIVQCFGWRCDINQPLNVATTWLAD